MDDDPDLYTEVCEEDTGRTPCRRCKRITGHTDECVRPSGARIGPGDLITDAGPGRTPVRGRVTAVINDVNGWLVIYVVTSRDHPVYAYGTELFLPFDSPNLIKRKRRTDGSK